ncbi:hypothetical protein [Nocardioides litoris]|uniref:hypothetical protein n=1 Tax=Nocardioides litoris TaxID=1926648 RepID=UPI001B864522|nr:hypothetical protein [Nocardioides litoris]
MMPDPGPGARVPRDLVAVPVTDVEPVPIVVVTRAGETSPLVAVFVALAQDVLAAA